MSLVARLPILICAWLQFCSPLWPTFYLLDLQVLWHAQLRKSLVHPQVLYSGNLGDENEQQLRMLCSEVSSALALGSARIKVSF